MGETKMEIAELDRLRQAYKGAVENWIVAIRAEEDLATPDHSVTAIGVWQHAVFLIGFDFT